MRELYTEVWIPPAVKDEFLEIRSIVRQASLERAPWIKTVRLSLPQSALAYAGLNRGEASVLALAKEHNARLVIIDERKARREAQRMGLQVTGTIGVLLLAKEKGLIDAIKPSIAELQAHGLYLTRTSLIKHCNLPASTINTN